MALGKRLGRPVASTSATVTSAANKSSPCRTTSWPELHARTGHVAEPGLDLKQIIDPRRLQELANHPPHDEAHAPLGLCQCIS